MDGVGKLSRKKSDYFDLMRKPTEQYVDNELEERYAVFKQKSELKKPYREEAFQEMEYKSFDWPYHKPPPAPPWPKPQPLPKPKPSPEPEPWPEPQPPPEGKVPPTPPWPERQPPPKGEPPPWTPWKLPPWPPWPKPQPWFVPYWGPGAGGWGAGSGSWGPGAGSWGPGSEGWGPDGDWGWNIRCVGCIITTQDKTCYNSCDDCYGEAHVSKACFKGHPSTNRNGQQYTWKVEGGNLKQITYYGNAICTDELFSGDSGGWGNGIKIYPNWDKIESDGDWKKANYTITLIDGLGYKCRDKIQLKCPSCICEETPNVAYDDANSDDTIDRNGTATIVVKDGCPPFSWSVSGTGFSIPASTDGRTNTLSADETACGTATITVTDHCGDNCTGYVRCTEGQWEPVEVWGGGGCGSLCGGGENTIYIGALKIYYRCTDCEAPQTCPAPTVVGPETGQSYTFSPEGLCGDPCSNHWKYGWWGCQSDDCCFFERRILSKGFTAEDIDKFLGGNEPKPEIRHAPKIKRLRRLPRGIRREVLNNTKFGRKKP